MIELSDFVEIARARGYKATAIEQDIWPAYQAVGGSVASFLNERAKDHTHEIENSEAAEDGADILYSPDAQAKYAKAHGDDALRAALAPHGLKVGQVKRDRPQGDGAKLIPSTNPFSDAFRGTAEARQARITSMIKGMGTQVVSKIAMAAGKRIDGTPIIKRRA